VTESGTTASQPTGKGRPTPKRSERERRRSGPVPPPPMTRKEAARRQREKAAEARSRVREGQSRGDERFLPKRDAGPVRKVVRDTVDGRRSANVLLLPLAVGLVLAQLSGSIAVMNVAVTLWLFGVLVILGDSMVTAFLIRQAVRRAFPEERKTVGHVLYGLLRSTVFRRWRMPPPTVKPAGLFG
jgi:hypothetical protein